MQHDHKKPDSDQKTETKARLCLVCNSSFASEWVGERICRKCKTSATWRSGVLGTRWACRREAQRNGSARQVFTPSEYVLTNSINREKPC
jgi:hypothetical protein